MAVEVFLPPLSFTSEITAYGYGYSPPGQYGLNIGSRYKVLWDNVEYSVEAIGAADILPGSVFIGNIKPIAPPGTGEPFLIGTVGGGLLIVCVDEEKATQHTVTIYKEVEDVDKPSFDIVLKDRDGTDVVYPATVVWLKTNDGAVRKFVNEDSVPVPVEKNDVEVDFTQGNMEIVPDVGNVFSKVTLNRPAELIPANIPEGMYIAGVGPGEYGATGEEIEEALCTFSCYVSGSKKVTTKNAGDQVISLSISLPLSSNIYSVSIGKNNLSQSSTTNLNYPAVGSSSVNVESPNNYTVTESATIKTVNAEYSHNFYSNYGSMIAFMFVVFGVPGIKIKKVGTDLVFHADANVVSLPEGGDFDRRYYITKVDLSESAITSLPNFAFHASSASYCKIKEVLFPKNVKSLGNNCFYGCASLKEMVIPDTVTSIGMYAFQYCRGLTRFIFPGSVTKIGSYCLNGCNSLTDLVISEGVQRIDASAFANCSKLTRVVIPDTVTTLGTSIFSSCTSLTDVTLPANLTAIPSNLFYGCSSLTQLTLPSGVTSIGQSAFSGCAALAVLDCSACTSVPTLDNTNAFTNCPSTMQIKVPAALYDSWKAATNWSTYASKIVAV